MNLNFHWAKPDKPADQQDQGWYFISQITDKSRCSDQRPCYILVQKIQFASTQKCVLLFIILQTNLRREKQE